MRPRPTQGEAAADARTEDNRTAAVIIRGHAFIQNLRAATTNSASMPEIVISASRRPSTNSPERSDRAREHTDLLPPPEHGQRNSARDPHGRRLPDPPATLRRPRLLRPKGRRRQNQEGGATAPSNAGSPTPSIDSSSSTPNSRPGRTPRERLHASVTGSHPEHRLFG